jgi:phosphatidylethanolamine/phosphatidyl-N-methylethanolamine N-methyltransferase
VGDARINGGRIGAAGAAMKRIREDPDHDEYLSRWSEIYERANYQAGLSAYFLRKSHAWSERPFSEHVHFPKVLEVGAGTGIHLSFVRHTFDEYWMTDVNIPFLERALASDVRRTRGKVCVDRQDAAALTYPENTFDRLIATHILEHLPQPHDALREWVRVVKPGGCLSLVLPCDPGVAWRVGRAIGSRGKFIEAGIDYDYWMAREHVNPINNLVAFVKHYFPEVRDQWLPLRIPSMDLNLFYIAHIHV